VRQPTKRASPLAASRSARGGKRFWPICDAAFAHGSANLGAQA